MRILIINHYAGSLDYGMEYRPFYFAREWAKAGHDVDIIAASYSHLRSKNPIIKKDFETERIDGVTYHWIKTLRYERNGARRVLTMFQFVSKLYCKAKKVAEQLHPDMVISSSTYPLDTYPARRIAKFAHAKLVHEVHDMWPLTLIELGGMSKWHPFVVLLQIAENMAYRCSDAIVSLLPYAKDYMIKHGMNSEKFNHIPNGIVLEDWDDVEDLPDEHQKTINDIKLSGKFIVGYFGGHALSNALTSFVDAATYLNSDNVFLLLVGQGVEKENLIQRAKKNGSENILFLPPVPKKSLPNLLNQVDALFIGATPSPLYRFGVSMNKLFDAMMAGIPIIYAVDAANNDVDKAKCGISVEPDNPEAIAKGIKQMMGFSSNMLSQMGNNGQNFVLKFNNYKVLADNFLDFMNGLNSKSK